MQSIGNIRETSDYVVNSSGRARISEMEDPNEKFIIIDGIKLPKKSLEYMTSDMRAYVRGREL